MAELLLRAVKARGLATAGWLAVLVLVLVGAAPLFGTLYFQNDPLVHVRWIAAAVALVVTVLARPRGLPLAELVAIRVALVRHDGLMVASAGAAVLVLSRTAAPSAWLAMVAWLVLVGGLLAALGFARRALFALAGLALLIYPPALVYDPAVAVLQRGAFGASAGILRALFADFATDGATIVVAGKAIAFTASCAGADFVMTFAALPLLFAADDARPRGLAATMAVGVALAFVLNVVRVVAIVALARGGYMNLALGDGHALVGEVVLFLGVVALLWKPLTR